LLLPPDEMCVPGSSAGSPGVGLVAEWVPATTSLAEIRREAEVEAEHVRDLIDNRGGLGVEAG
jgi:hypothetical protein